MARDIQFDKPQQTSADTLIIRCGIVMFYTVVYSDDQAFPFHQEDESIVCDWEEV